VAGEDLGRMKNCGSQLASGRKHCVDKPMTLFKSQLYAYDRQMNIFDQIIFQNLTIFEI